MAEKTMGLIMVACGCVNCVMFVFRIVTGMYDVLWLCISLIIAGFGIPYGIVLLKKS